MQVKKEYTLITNIGHLQKALSHIEEADYLTFDVEATGLNVRKDKVIGFGFCGKIGEAFYVPLFKWDVSKKELIDIDQYSSTIFSALSNKHLITHNGSYDVRICNHNLGLDFRTNLVADTIVMWHTLNEDGPFGLKKICSSLEKELRYDAESTALKEKEEMDASIKANGGSTTKNNYEMYKADWDKIGYYCCADVDMTLRLFEYCYDQLEKDEQLLSFFFDEEVMPLYRTVTIKMEEMPVKLDLPFIEKHYSKLLDKLNYYEEEVIKKLEETEEFQNWLSDVVKNSVKTTKGSKFGQEVVNYFNIDLPKSPKTGKYSVSKKNIESCDAPDYVKQYFLTEEGLSKSEIEEISKITFLKENEDKPINLSSKQQLADLVFNYFRVEPISYTKKTGSPQFNDKIVDMLPELGFDWGKSLKIYNRLCKIKSAYFDRFLEGQEDGYYYFSYKQHGTISGRYGSDAQQLPRPMEEGEDYPDVIYFSNMIRRFFISGEGRLFVDADYESLEPHVFAHVSGDEGLRNIFRKGHDFYSTIAIATEKLTGVSADKKADNYLGNVNKPLRQSAKAYSLGVPYGMGDYALGKSLDIPTEDAAKLIDGYLGGFPELKKWMKRSEYMAQTKGFVKSEAGRVRHLPEVKKLYAIHKGRLMDFKYRNKLISQKRKQGMSKKEATELVTGWYLDYKNGVNNAKNFQIQSLSGSIVNRAAIRIQEEFEKRGIDAWVCAQVHDQLIFNIPEDRKDECVELIQNIMETNYKLSLDLKAPPEVSKNWRDGH